MALGGWAVEEAVDDGKLRLGAMLCDRVVEGARSGLSKAVGYGPDGMVW